MLRHHDSPAHLGRFDPDWVRAHDRLISQQRLRSDHEAEGTPWWVAVFSRTIRTTRPDTGR